MSFISDKLASELNDKETRELYLAAQSRTAIVSQIRGIRADRGWSQAEFAKALGKPQSNVSQRLENRDYGGFTLSTLLEIANVFDVGLLVKFVPYEEFIEATDDLSTSAVTVRKFDPAALARVTKSAKKLTSEMVESAANHVSDTAAPKLTEVAYEALLKEINDPLGSMNSFVGRKPEAETPNVVSIENYRFSESQKLNQAPDLNDGLRVAV